MRLHTNYRFTYTAIAFCAIAMFLFAGVAVAKEFWESKTFDKWTQKECQKMLTDSPWVKELNLTGMNYEGADSASATDSQAPYIKYTVQIRSAAPVRQAVVRQARIAKKYDSLSADQKQAFDKDMDAFLTGASPEYVMVYVSIETNNRDHSRDLIRHWETRTTDLLKNGVYLSTPRGKKVQLAQFIPGSGGSLEFQFIFPRVVDGEEILKPSDKSLQLEFEYPILGCIRGTDRGCLGDGRAFIDFKTDKMKIDNAVIY